ncbi:hypothetical protein DA2_2265 [Desulfovibrio sp. A2]|nr:hypothetical protein DA2_2265 [Desulfovibrio sp. A2]
MRQRRGVRGGAVPTPSARRAGHDGRGTAKASIPPAAMPRACAAR